MVLLQAVRRAAPAGTSRDRGRCALLASLWVTVPLLADAKWTALNEFQVGTEINDSYGRRSPRLARSGQLYDYRRFPIVRSSSPSASGLRRMLPHTTSARGGSSRCGCSACSSTSGGRRSASADRLPGQPRPALPALRRGRPARGPLPRGARRGLARPSSRCLRAVRTLATPCSRAHFDRPRHRPRLPPLASSCSRSCSPRRGARFAPTTRRTRRGSTSSRTSTRPRARRSVAAPSTSPPTAAAVRVYAGMPSNWGHRSFVGGVQPYNYMENTNVDAMGSRCGRSRS